MSMLKDCDMSHVTYSLSHASALKHCQNLLGMSSESLSILSIFSFLMIFYALRMSLEYTRKKVVKLWLYSEYSECTRNTLGTVGECKLLCFVCHKSRHMSQECPMGKVKGMSRKDIRGKAGRDSQLVVAFEQPQKRMTIEKTKSTTPSKRMKQQQYTPSWNNCHQTNAANFWQKSTNRIFRLGSHISGWRS